MSAGDLVSGEIKHTATPWFYQENSDAYTHIVRPEHSKGMIVVQLSQDKSGQSEADARFIVRACNAHDDLVTSLNDLYTLIHDMGWTSPDDRYASITNAAAVLAKAGVK